MWEITVDLVYSLKTKRRFNSHAKCAVWVSTKLTSLLLVVMTSTVATASKKVKNNGHFHPQFANIAFHIKSYSFSVVKNKQTRPGFLVLENFITCWPPEKPRDISPWTRAKMAGIVSKVYYFSTGLTHNSNILVACKQALCLGKKSLFPLPSSPLDQRPVHRLISSWHSCFKISHSRAFRVCGDSSSGIFSFALGLLFWCTKLRVKLKVLGLGLPYES